MIFLTTGFLNPPKADISKDISYICTNMHNPMKSKNTFLRLIIPLFTILFMTSCHDEDREDYPVYSPLVGTWELLEDPQGPVPQYMIDYYTFNNNGVGTYESYDDYNQWNQWVMSWRTYSDGWNRLIITFEDGITWEYYWEIADGYLYLYDPIDPEYYLIYRPIY